MKISTLLTLVLLTIAGASTAQATQCNDGSYSNSTGSGTCSHHGGESK